MTRQQRLYERQIRTIYKEINAQTRVYGRLWYQFEHVEAGLLAARTGYSLRRICACLAVLSPRCQWLRTKKACRELVDGQRPRGIFGRNIAKATAILSSQNGVPIDPRRAPKTWAFWQNLWDPDDPDPVTLDSWMLRAHGLPVSVSFATYQGLADAYRRVAPKFSLLPNQLQATVWLHVKKKTTKRKERRNTAKEK